MVARLICGKPGAFPYRACSGGGLHVFWDSVRPANPRQNARDLASSRDSLRSAGRYRLQASTQRSLQILTEEDQGEFCAERVLPHPSLCKPLVSEPLEL